MDLKSTEHTHGQIECKPGVGNNNQGNSMDDSINTDILPHCSQSHYNTHGVNIDSVGRLNIDIEGNQLRNPNLLDHENSLNTTNNCKNGDSVDGEELALCDRTTVSSVCGSDVVMCDVVKLLDTTLVTPVAGEATDSQTVAFEIPHMTRDDSDAKQDNVSKRCSGSGSDLESLGDMSGTEEGDIALIVGELDEPCECDECLFDTEPDAKVKPTPLLKKVLRVLSLLLKYLLCFNLVQQQ